jgi:potassium/chloride transporter 4/5/6
MCVLGKRLLKDININDCNKKPFGPLHQIFCGNSSSEGAGSCDPYFEANNVSKVRGIKGLSSGVFLGKLYTNKYQDYGQVVSP